MTVGQSLLAFVPAAALLAITPGVDTALVLNTAAGSGKKSAALAALGICVGCLVWGALVALGLGALFVTSRWSFGLLRWAGALYLGWLGLQLLWKPRQSWSALPPLGAAASQGLWFRRGLLTNLLNPKVGGFYVMFLPQFVPSGVAVGAFSFALVSIHAALSALWFCVLLLMTAQLTQRFAKPAWVRALDRLTGAVLLVAAVALVLK